MRDIKKMLLMPVIIISICISSCKDKGNNKEKTVSITVPDDIIAGAGVTKANHDTVSAAIIDYGFKSLQRLNYKFPEGVIFQKRIKEVYGIDITKFQNRIIPLRIDDFPETVIKNYNYLLVQDSDASNDYYINEEVLKLYNQYIITNNKSSLNLLKVKDPYLLKDLVVYYGYNGDKDLVKFVFKDFAFGNATDFHSLIFSKKNSNNQFVLRKSLLDDIENIVYSGKTQELLAEAREGKGYDSLGDILEMIVKNPGEYDSSNQTLSFLCEKSLNVGDLGTVQLFLQKHQVIKDKLTKENYYNFERLKMFSENLAVIGNGGLSE